MANVVVEAIVSGPGSDVRWEQTTVIDVLRVFCHVKICIMLLSLFHIFLAFSYDYDSASDCDVIC